jgi:hypothetical protein
MDNDDPIRRPPSPDTAWGRIIARDRHLYADLWDCDLSTEEGQADYDINCKMMTWSYTLSALRTFTPCSAASSQSLGVLGVMEDNMLSRLVSGGVLGALVGAAMVSSGPSSAFTLSSPSLERPVATAGIQQVYYYYRHYYRGPYYYHRYYRPYYHPYRPYYYPYSYSYYHPYCLVEVLGLGICW